MPAPGVAMTRPWRLTRRRRVEMEAALAALRGIMVPRRSVSEEEVWWAIEDGQEALGIDPNAGWDGEIDHVAAVRVAIALRAALRADEDARCEEALRRVGHGEETGATPGDGWDVGYDEGAEAVAHAMREWAELDRGWSWTVPLALWERA